jgi:hypothetical protein
VLTVAFNAGRFAPLAHAQCRTLGLALPIVFLPDPLRGRPVEEIRAVADEKYPEFLRHVLRDFGA